MKYFYRQDEKNRTIGVHTKEKAIPAGDGGTILKPSAYHRMDGRWEAVYHLYDEEITERHFVADTLKESLQIAYSELEKDGWEPGFFIFNYPLGQ